MVSLSNHGGQDIYARIFDKLRLTGFPPSIFKTKWHEIRKDPCHSCNPQKFENSCLFIFKVINDQVGKLHAYPFLGLVSGSANVRGQGNFRVF